MAASAGTLPVYLRVGDASEAHIGDLELGLDVLEAGAAAVVTLDPAALPGLLREAAAELEATATTTGEG